MSIFLIILGVLLLVIAGLVFFASRKPDTVHYERSATIKAAPEKIFPLINDFHNWSQWSPWAKLDPAQKTTYSGAASGVGAVQEWEGNKQVGQGRMEILESTAPSHVTIDLQFLKPFKAHNTTEFQLTPGEGSTNVLWTMDGTQNFMLKFMCMFMDMDKLIGKDFEKGLASMKEAAER